MLKSGRVESTSVPSEIGDQEVHTGFVYSSDLGTASIAGAMDLDDGLKAHRDGDYATAFQESKAL